MLRPRIRLFTRARRVLVLRLTFSGRSPFLIEPLLFGLPIVYNVNLFVPFIGAPMVCSMTTYAAFAIGFLSKTIVQQPWPTPVGLGGYIATVSWRGAVVAIIKVIIAFLIWYPFIKRYDNKLLKQEEAQKSAEANA